MAMARGHCVSLSWQRRLVADLMHCSRGMPLATIQRTMDLGPIAEARSRCPQRPSWVVLFVKAFALLAKERPELRRSYQPYLWPHFYEHPESIGMTTVERTDAADAYPMVVRLRCPEEKSIAEMTEKVRRCKSADLDDLSELRAFRRFGRLPGLLRRVVWWAVVNLSGAWRAHNVGTFGVTSLAAEGAGASHVLSLTTSTLHFGEPKSDRRIEVHLSFDHRVYDGGVAARSLKRLEEILNTEIVAELQAEATAQAA